MSAAEKARVPWAVGDIVLSTYLIERRIARGGMGDVYLARNRFSHTRFAIKRARLDSAGRRVLLRELLSWTSLPEHPNLVPCRFFRSVGGEIAIFSDYVEGGTLKDWIGARRAPNVVSVVDLAIQIAWGLHIAHEASVIHRDVKPANVLMTTDGTPRITDFGLAGASAGVGMTIEYCSPEQASGDTLTPATDLWSWGVTVLEMIIGDCSWATGVAAPHILDDLRSNGASDACFHLPPALGAVLERCFVDVSERWASLLAAAEALIAVYQTLTSRPYPRAFQGAARAGARGSAATDDWAAPETLARAAWVPTPLADTMTIALPPAPTTRMRWLADLVVYDEISTALSTNATFASGVSARERRSLLLDKARIHEALEDPGGAVECYDAVVALTVASQRDGDPDLQSKIGQVALRKAEIVQRMGDHRYAYALTVWGDRHVEDHRSKGFARLIQARCLRALGKRTEARDLAVQATKELMVADRSDRTTEILLAEAYIEAGEAEPGNSLEDAKQFDHAIRILEARPLGERLDVVRTLASAHTNLARLFLRSTPDAAHWPIQRALSLLDPLAAQHPSDDLVLSLVTVLLTRARLEGAEALHATLTRAVALHEALIVTHGRSELTHTLALTHLEICDIHRRAGRHANALRSVDCALGYLEPLIESDRTEVISIFVEASILRARLRRRLRLPGARDDIARAIASLRSFRKKHRADWLAPLLWALRVLWWLPWLLS